VGMLSGILRRTWSRRRNIAVLAGRGKRNQREAWRVLALMLHSELMGKTFSC